MVLVAEFAIEPDDELGRNRDIVEFLVENDADPSIANDEGTTPIACVKSAIEDDSSFFPHIGISISRSFSAGRSSRAVIGSGHAEQLEDLPMDGGQLGGEHFDLVAVGGEDGVSGDGFEDIQHLPSRRPNTRTTFGIERQRLDTLQLDRLA